MDRLMRGVFRYRNIECGLRFGKKFVASSPVGFVAGLLCQLHAALEVMRVAVGPGDVKTAYGQQEQEGRKSALEEHSMDHHRLPRRSNGTEVTCMARVLVRSWNRQTLSSNCELTCSEALGYWNKVR